MNDRLGMAATLVRDGIPGPLRDDDQAKLERAFVVSGADRHYAHAVAGEVAAGTADTRYVHGAAAVRALIHERVTVSAHNGRLLTLDDIAWHITKAAASPQKAARAIVLAAVASGGCLDRKRPAWQHMQDVTRTTRGGRRPSHPVRGVGSPSTARAMYNLAVGERGQPGSKATAARGLCDR